MWWRYKCQSRCTAFPSFVRLNANHENHVFVTLSLVCAAIVARCSFFVWGSNTLVLMAMQYSRDRLSDASFALMYLATRWATCKIEGAGSACPIWQKLSRRPCLILNGKKKKKKKKTSCPVLRHVLDTVRVAALQGRVHWMNRRRCMATFDASLCLGTSENEAASMNHQPA